MPTAFNLGPDSVCVGCDASVPVAGAGIGFYMAAGSKAVACTSKNCAYGFDWKVSAVASLAVGCKVTGATVGYRVPVGAENSGAAFCSATTTSNCMSYLSKYAIDFGNYFTSGYVSVAAYGANWYDKRPDVKASYVASVGTNTATITPEPANYLFNALRCTYSGNVAVTVGAPAGGTNYDDGTEMSVIIQAVAGCSVTGVTWNGVFLGGTTGAVAASNYRQQGFIYKKTANRWVPYGTAATVTGDIWL